MIDHQRLKELLHYDPETGLFKWLVRRSSRVPDDMRAGTPDKDGYVQIKADGRIYKAHRLAWFYMTGEWPSLLIDHINGAPADNRFANLRQATNSQNLHNRPAVKGSKGCHFYKAYGKWVAEIKVKGKRTFLGYYDTEEEARDAYTTAAKDLVGEFAWNTHGGTPNGGPICAFIVSGS